MAIEGLEIMMSRLDGCRELLAAQQIESDVMVGMDGDLPILMMYFEQGDVQLTCLPMDTDDRMEHFLLELRTEPSLPNLDDIGRSTLCELFDDLSLAGYAYMSGDDGTVIYRQMMPEAILPTGDQTFLYFVELYVQYLGVLLELAGRIAAAENAEGQKGGEVE
jgi:hypothetical protein